MITRRRTAFCLNLLALLAHAELGLDDARRAAQDELRGRPGITLAGAFVPAGADGCAVELLAHALVRGVASAAPLFVPDCVLHRARVALGADAPPGADACVSLDAARKPHL